MRFILLLITFFILTTLVIAQNKMDIANPLDILNVFVGEWEGSATAFYPRIEGKENREETIYVTCRKVLKGTYIECNSIYKQTNGNSRELLVYWNYDAKADSFQILYLYDNWPGKVNYPLYFDTTERLFTGYDTFTVHGSIPAEERVETYISEDGNEIRHTEYNHYQTDPEDYWVKSFESVWKRKR